MDLELELVHQMNGDVRIDDVSDDAPMMKVEFFNEWARWLTPEDKEAIIAAAYVRLTEIFDARDDA